MVFALAGDSTMTTAMGFSGGRRLARRRSAA